MTYKDFLKSGKWQQKRLEVMNRDGFKCVICGEVNDLTVHHLYYEPNKKPWEYDDEVLQTLCSNCHNKIHKDLGKLSGIIAFRMLKGELDATNF